MKVLIIEDELPARDKIAKFIERYDRKIKIVSNLESVSQSAKWFTENETPELIFADIELLDGNIFALFEQIEISCPIIFTTAYDQFLLPAFERNGIAYLLKPFSYEKFSAAMQKFENLRENLASAQMNFWREIQADLHQPKFKERFVIKTRDGIQLLETKQISFIQMQNELPFAFDATGKKFPLNNSLSTLEKMLDPKQFFRINRSEIVNIDYIENLKPDFRDRLEIKLKNLKVRLFSSASRTSELKKWLENA
ncbi:MAG TPA: LytTR family DNA-binding domain-containing protein [Pyrinomonadaceae bacterium]|nr:LytTR family DNA-binding domain-containing protein [Pyrinomonadaceae bacterium]